MPHKLQPVLKHQLPPAVFQPLLNTQTRLPCVFGPKNTHATTICVAVSKTCNVGDHVTYDEFKTLYFDAWKAGCKGITTFRAAGKRYGILNEVKPDTSNDNETEAAEACFIHPDTGMRSCE